MMQFPCENGKEETRSTVRIMAGVRNKVRLMCWNKCILAFSGINVYLVGLFLIAISWEELIWLLFKSEISIFPLLLFSLAAFFCNSLMYFALP